MRESRSILLLVTDLELGGTPTVVRELAIRLNNPPGVKVEVACLGGHGLVVDQLRTAGIRTIPLGARGPADFSVFRRLHRLVREGGYDTVFSFLIHANAAAAVIAPFSRKVRFLQSIQTTQPDPRWHWNLQRIVHHAAERVIVPSPSVASVAEKWSHIPPEKIAIIPNAVELSDFAGISRVAGNPIRIGFIGRLDPIKRIPDLLEAVRILDGRVQLHIFGDGRERPIIEADIARMYLGSQVTLHGSIARPREALEQIALLVLPSAAEGFGLVLIEAMAAGIPVVATNVPGIRDVVRDRETGLLVAPASPAQLAEAIRNLIDDPMLRNQLIASAREDVARRFSWDAVIPRYRALLGIQQEVRLLRS